MSRIAVGGTRERTFTLLILRLLVNIKCEIRELISLYYLHPPSKFKIYYDRTIDTF